MVRPEGSKASVERSGITTWGSGLTRGNPFDVAVVMPTLLRSSLTRALRSIFDQDIAGTVQILIGIDAREGPADIAAEYPRLPANMAVTVVDPGYSTARNRGGLHDALGGSLRAVLSLLAHAPHVAYLDDDCWWAPHHLSSLHSAIRTRDWAYGLRWYVAPDVPLPLGIDTFESVGPTLGTYAKNEGGFCDTNTLMIDKTRCEDAIMRWSRAQRGHPTGRGADRVVFASLLAHEKFGATGKPTSYYEISESDNMHGARLAFMRKELKPVDGYRRYAMGEYMAAAIDFYRHSYLTGKPDHALTWACSALLRLGERRTASKVVGKAGDLDGDPCWRALTGPEAPELSGHDGNTACRMAFFRSQRLLADGDAAGARRWLAQALQHGEAGRPERAVAAAELQRLEKKAG